MAEVLRFPWVGGMPDRDADVVLEEAKGKLRRVLILGWDADGESYSNISFTDGGDAMWLLEWAKGLVIRGPSEEPK